MKKLAFLAVAVMFSATAFAQSYATKTGHISFFSTSAMENIQADNYKVKSSIDAATGEISFEMLIKGFHFEKALMEEHFNEPEYLDSETYPKASFKGKLDPSTKVDFTKDGEYIARVTGELTMHGVTKTVQAGGKIIIKGGKPTVKADFQVVLKDFNISGKAVKSGVVSGSIKVTVDTSYEKK